MRAADEPTEGGTRRKQERFRERMSCRFEGGRSRRLRFAPPLFNFPALVSLSLFRVFLLSRSQLPSSILVSVRHTFRLPKSPRSSITVLRLAFYFPSSCFFFLSPRSSRSLPVPSSALFIVFLPASPLSLRSPPPCHAAPRLTVSVPCRCESAPTSPTPMVSPPFQVALIIRACHAPTR